MDKENYEILWEQVLLPKIESLVTSIAYESFIKLLVPVDIKGNTIVLCTQSKIFADGVNNQMIGSKIKEAIIKANTHITDYCVVVAKDKEDYLKQLGEERRDEIENQGSPINTQFTFDSFVVGSSNEFIYAAAKAVAEAPGDSYNPLFIYGGTGLGKTHILMAIANYIKLHNPTLNVVYATCEQFTNQFIEGISKGKGTNASADFRRRYRNVDVLLIDDVQFLATKQGIQTEFFHTFNELVMQNKQVVLTSDRPPKEIEVLEERLRTRFEGGLLADVQPPDLETRIAILKRKAEEKKCVVNIKVLTYIAEMNVGDIRTLIGKLTKVIFASKLHERPITIELVNDALKESAGERQEELRAEDIINGVCQFYKVSKTELLSKKKTKEIALARQVSMYLVLDMMSLPSTKVGKIFGRDHATVTYTRDKISEQIEVDTKLAVDINDIKKKLLKQ
ncbi:MAG: chromosomal replication initiator protein DnaA [Clostridiales bacterium]|nr:chromosomal replication initiator protein DnaA [Clostridiales bacterium]